MNVESETGTDPLAFVIFGAAIVDLWAITQPRNLVHGAVVATLLFAALRRRPALPHLAAVMGGAAFVLGGAWAIQRGGFFTFFAMPVTLGAIAGGIIGWRRPPKAWPGFHFLRQDFMEFCGFVGVLASFPAVLGLGVTGAADLAGRFTFELAFLGAWVLLPMSVIAHAIGFLRRGSIAAEPMTPVESA